MKVQAVPKIVAIHNEAIITNSTKTAIISILSTNDERIFKDTDKAITVWFDDIHPKTTMTLASCMDFKAMDVNDAMNIISFIKGLSTDIELIIVHCTAGICRSGAVADFIRVVCDCDDIEFLAMNSHIIPNEWCLDLLWMIWKMRGNGLI
jgi:predicted protein tyrosine phosphatase